MKTYILLFFAISFANAQDIYFPDLNLKAKLLSATITNGVAFTGGSIANPATFIHAKIDLNNDGEIQQSEAAIITQLHISYANISNLEGLQYFTSLITLNCEQNSISSVSPLGLSNLESLDLEYAQLTTISISGFLNLKYLSCNGNNLTSLNLSNLPSLLILDCSYSQLSSVDFSGLPALTSANCSYNLFNSLDFSSNPHFDNLFFDNNPNLTFIKIKNGATQLFVYDGTSVAIPCVSNVPNLNQICADNAEIPALQSYLAGCGISQPIIINSTCLLGVLGFNDDAIISVVPNPSKDIFNIDLTKKIEDYTSISIYNLLGKQVFTTTINPKQYNAINLSKLPNGCYIATLNSNINSTTLKLIKN